MEDLQALLAQEGGQDLVHVLDAPRVQVGRFVHVEDLAVQVARRREVATAQRGLEAREHIVQIFLEAGPGQEVEHPAREEQAEHLAGGQRQRFAPSGRHQPPDFAPVRNFRVLVGGLVVCSI